MNEHFEILPCVIDGIPWRIAVVDSGNMPGERTLEPRFFKDGAWHPGTLGTVEDCGPYGLPGALSALYRKNRYKIEAHLARKHAPQETLSILADLDREALAKARERENELAIIRAARAQALDDSTLRQP